MAIAIAIVGSIGGPAFAADRETVLHSFSDARSDMTGEHPFWGPVIDISTSAIYGFAEGGKNGSGVLYQILPPTAATPRWSFSVIYTNSGNSASLGLGPYVYAANGVVYGAGSYKGSGVFYSLTPPKSGAGDWTPKILYTFTGNDGGGPDGPLTMDAQGALYGVAFGAPGDCQKTADCGTVLKLAPPSAQGQSWSLSVLYRFPGGVSGQNPFNGVVLDKQGNLYGSAPFDYPSSKSLIFKLTRPAGAGPWTASTLYRFYPTSTCYSSGPLAIDANGALYGVFSANAAGGGSCNDGANEYVFQLAPSKSNPDVWVKTVIRTFTNSNQAGGYLLEAPLTLDASGNVYGVTEGGGKAQVNGDQTQYGGAVFELQPGVPGKWVYKALFDFLIDIGSREYSTTGVYANGGLALDSAGNLYGTTVSGGLGNMGVIFRLKQ
jgi:hypothetical protein